MIHNFSYAPDRNEFLELQSQALRNQVEELVEQQRQRDAQIDDFSEALDARVQELKVSDLIARS